MAEMDIKTIALIAVVVIFSVLILYLAVRIMFKMKKGDSGKKTRKTKVLKAIPTDSSSESDSIFNSITASKRISGDLKRRGIDTGAADSLIKKAESEYDLGRENNAKRFIKEAKELLLSIKEGWDQKTGFDVVPTTSADAPKKAFKESVDLAGSAGMEDTDIHKPEEEFPELKKAVEKKPDNFLPSKFTISLAQKVVEDAKAVGGDTNSAQNFLIQAKDCFSREDYDESFRLALCCKREAETILGLGSGKGSGEDKGISDLATLASESEPLKTCTICGNKRVAYICIESESGEEATCRHCYDKAMGATVVPDLPPPPPPPDFTKETPEAEEEKEQHFCPNCGSKVMAEDVFCGKCGKPVKEELKCVGCGTKVEPGDVFCRKCGARLVT
jgi:ribosomal protein S27AE